MIKNKNSWCQFPIPFILNKVGGELRQKLKFKVTITPGIKILDMTRGFKDKEKTNHSPSHVDHVRILTLVKHFDSKKEKSIMKDTLEEENTKVGRCKTCYQK